MTGQEEIDQKFNKNLLLGYFMYTTFVGAFRKWIFSGSSVVENLLLLLQIFAPLILTYFMRRKRGALFYFPMMPLTLVLLVMAFNPLSHTIFHSVFGFVLHIGFWIMVLIYIQERDSFPVEELLGAMAIACLVQSILGAMQFSLPADHFINRYVSDNNDVAGFGNGFGTRVIGTFSYISGYGAFMVFYGMYVWALMIENKRSLWLIYGLAVLGLVAAFMNGSRSVVLPFVLSVFFGFLNYGYLGTKLKVVAAIVLVAILAFVFDAGEKLDFIGNSYDAFSARVEAGQATGETSDRTKMTFDAVLNYNGNYPLFGVGLGATYQGAVAKWGTSPLVPVVYEAEPERVLIEGGYFLFIVRLLLMIYLIFQMKIPVYFSAPILFFLFMFSLLVFNINQPAYTFFGLMVVDKMYHLKEQKRALENG